METEERSHSFKYFLHREMVKTRARRVDAQDKIQFKYANDTRV